MGTEEKRQLHYRYGKLRTYRNSLAVLIGGPTLYLGHFRVYTLIGCLSLSCARNCSHSRCAGRTCTDHPENHVIGGALRSRCHLDRVVAWASKLFRCSSVLFGLGLIFSARGRWSWPQVKTGPGLAHVLLEEYTIRLAASTRKNGLLVRSLEEE